MRLATILRLLSLHRAKPFHDARGDDTDWNEAILIGSGPFPTLLVPGGSSSRTAAGDALINSEGD